MLVSCYSKPLQCSLKKPQIKHDFFKNEGVILEKLIQVNLELVFFCDFYFLPTEFRAWKAKNLLNLAREFCRNFVEQNLNENKSSGKRLYTISDNVIGHKSKDPIIYI